MKSVSKNIIALVILGIAVFVFRNSILNSYFTLQDKYLPCTRIITYSIGNFDANFGINEEDFLSAIKEGEDMWEKSINKDLFTYKSEGGELTINLVYDNRQKITQELKVIDKTLENNKSSYNELKSELDALQAEYQQKKSILESKITTLKNRQTKYEKDVTYWNSRGGAPKDIFNSLNREKKYLDDSVSEINILQAELNIYIDNINTLVDELNKSASSFNSQAKDYNTIGNNLGEEFEEGLYYSNKNDKIIEIYQFENKGKLARVLMHELGHALLLEHIDNPKAIMYRLNNGVNLVPTEDDINALKTHCGLK